TDDAQVHDVQQVERRDQYVRLLVTDFARRGIAINLVELAEDVARLWLLRAALVELGRRRQDVLFDVGEHALGSLPPRIVRQRIDDLDLMSPALLKGFQLVFQSSA